MSLTKSRSLVVLAGVAAVTVVAVRWQPAPRPSAPAAALGPAPDFRASDLGGQPVSLSAYKGQTILLNFWASWCDACRYETPALDRLHQRLKDKGFSVVALSVDEGGRRPVMAFVARYNPTFPVLLADRRAPAAYGVYALPASYLIDRGGAIRKRYIGPINERAVENDILGVIGETR